MLLWFYVYSIDSFAFYDFLQPKCNRELIIFFQSLFGPKKATDKAMYRSKKKGKRTYTFYSPQENTTKKTSHDTSSIS